MAIARLYHEQSLSFAGASAASAGRVQCADVPLEVVLARMERAIGDEAMALVRQQLELWTRSGLTDGLHLASKVP